MSGELPVIIPQELAEKAAQFGYIGLFAHRETLQKAYDASMAIIEACDDKAAACTALMICMNTGALLKARQVDTIDELRELARATVAFIEQGSNSDRRRQALVEGARTALIHAEEQFGPEGK